ncbi:MAG: hypothetical protein CSA44_00350 [Gammaproteobacteria bacterium]|nr:MAG: hypothetical protein CSA44_00350 [Gammaproteobacteria bacterium]
MSHARKSASIPTPICPLLLIPKALALLRMVPANASLGIKSNKVQAIFVDIQGVRRGRQGKRSFYIF